MTDREVMQMALDALDSDNPDIQLRAAVALRAALAQGEQEPVAFLANATRFKLTLTENDCKITNLPRELGGRWVALVAAENDCHLNLITPLQREWKSLTVSELDDIDNRVWSQTIDEGLPMGDYCLQLARAIETKLKEKNT